VTGASDGAREPPPDVTIVGLDATTAPAWAALFEACQSPCYCRYWHFAGKKNEWLDRCFHHPEENREEQLTLVRSAAPEARGLLALEGDTAVGWMKLAPRALLPKITQQGAYRPLALGPSDGVWSIGCFLVRPDRRARGVALALVSAAPRFVQTWAPPSEPARAIEAYPRGATDPALARLHDEQAWVGTEALFERCGYARVAGEPAYPVMRRLLEGGLEDGLPPGRVSP
jgi:GNAT superfamily N-acetyltransferase